MNNSESNKLNVSELMKSSKEALEGKWGLAIGTFFIFLLLSISIQIASEQMRALAIISMLISGPYALGLSRFALQISRNEETRFEVSLSGFSNFLNAFLANLLMGIIIIGGMILFIIPGIIAALALSMTFFIMAEDDTISPIDALKKSHHMMDGHKMNYFLLTLRYLGLSLLCILTLGIGLFWLMPYIYVTNAKFYDKIKDAETVDLSA